MLFLILFHIFHSMEQGDGDNVSIAKPEVKYAYLAG